MEVKDLKDKHKDQLCFIYGGGPSLRHIDETQLKDYVNITVNSGFVKNRLCDYFVSDDSTISSWTYYDSIWKFSCIKLLYKDRFEPICSQKENCVFYTHTWWYSPSDKKYNLDGLKLTKEEPIVGTRTSMGSALHLAFIMGADPIVLLGNDCKLSKDGKRYFWQYKKKNHQPFRIKGHAFDKRTQNWGFDKDDFVEYWDKFAEYNKDIIGKEVEIIDCSDSNLNCFPKMHIQEILDKYGSKKNE